MIIETEAIILQAKKYSDSSKIITLYSKNFGKITLIAKGAFSIKSSFGGCLEPLSFVNISFYHKSNSNLHLLKTAEIITHHNKINKKYLSLITGLITSEIIITTQKENFQCEQIFIHFVNLLDNINNYKQEFAFFFGIQFLILLTQNMGFDVLEKNLNSPIFDELNQITNAKPTEITNQSFLKIVLFLSD